MQRCKHLSMETTPSALKLNRSETQGWSQGLPTLGCKKQPPSGLKRMWAKRRPNSAGSDLMTGNVNCTNPEVEA
jgi:hypothetical protein